MDDIITILLLAVVAVVSWIWQKMRESPEQEKKNRPQRKLTLEDLFTDPSEIEKPKSFEVAMEERPPVDMHADADMHTDADMHADADMHTDVDMDAMHSWAMREDTDQQDKGEPVETMPERMSPDVALQENQEPTDPSRMKGKPRTVAGIPINPRGIRQGIIISEVLGKPKSMR